MNGHEQATCNHEGGDMEGYTIDDCIAEQRRINETHYHDERSTKAARTSTERDEQDANDGTEADESEAEGNKATLEKWFGMRSQ